MSARLCSVCAARPALLHESVCFDCFEMKETEREVARLGRQLASALRRIEVLEQKVRRAPRRTQKTPLPVRHYTTGGDLQRRQDARRTYNREWMRAYRARQKVHEAAA